jgi:hypothetical protein
LWLSSYVLSYAPFGHHHGHFLAFLVVIFLAIVAIVLLCSF